MHRSLGAAVKKQGMSEEDHAHRLILADCSKQPDCLAKKYNFNVYPMYMMFYGGKLVFIGNKFNGFGSEVADIEKEIEKRVGMAKKNIFLPDDFRFIDPTGRTTTFKDV